MQNQGCLTPDEFLEKLPSYFTIANQKRITVRLSVKRLIIRDPIEPTLEVDSNKPEYDVSLKAQSVSVEGPISDKKYQLLVRASYGSHDKKVKCSTVVDSDNLDKFWQEYSTVVRSGMSDLVKKKKKKVVKKSLK